MEPVKFAYQCPLAGWEAISELAMLAEKNGFDAVTMADHLVGMGIRNFEALEAWTALAALATLTKRVRLGSIVSDVHRHHPAVLGQMVTTADHVSGGRVFLGVGAGEAMNLNPYGIRWDRPVSRTAEAVRLLRELWANAPNPISFRGQYYHVDGGLLARPLQKPHPPIWVAGNSPRMIKLAAELGDAWIPYAPITPQVYGELLAQLRARMAEANRGGDSVTPALFNYFVVSGCHEEARRLIELPAKMFALLASHSTRRLGYPVTDRFDILRFSFSDPERVKEFLREAESLPARMVDGLGFLYGTPDEVIGQIEEFADAGVRFFVLAAFVSPKMMRGTLQLFGEKILPYFEEGRSRNRRPRVKAREDAT